MSKLAIYVGAIVPSDANEEVDRDVPTEKDTRKRQRTCSHRHLYRLLLLHSVTLVHFLFTYYSSYIATLEDCVRLYSNESQDSRIGP